MRGLIVKDMLVMRKTLRTYAVFLLFYLVMSALDLFPISFTTADPDHHHDAAHGGLLL